MIRIFLLGALMGCVLINGQLTTEGDTSVVLLGDFNLFTCKGSLDDNPNSNDVGWFFKHQNGEYFAVNASDIGETREFMESKNWKRSSFIRVNSPAIIELFCAKNHEKPLQKANAFELKVEELMPIDPFMTSYCEKDGKKNVILKKWGWTFRGQFWVSHVVKNKHIAIDSVTEGVKLFCFSSSPVKWVLEKTPANFQYETLMPNEDSPCYLAELVISPFQSSDAQKLKCQSVSKGAEEDVWVELAVIGPRITPEEFNKTQSCVEHIGGAFFGSQTLGWTTAGGGVMSLVMMVGMVFLKRQLNQARGSN